MPSKDLVLNIPCYFCKNKLYLRQKIAHNPYPCHVECLLNDVEKKFNKRVEDAIEKLSKPNQLTGTEWINTKYLKKELGLK